ncbi:MAG: replication initiator protein A [Fuerstiella sp.]
MTSDTQTQTETQESRPRFRPQPTQALDELNLAEFPLNLLSDRVPAGCTSLRFEDRVFDKSKNDYVKRSLVVSASGEYGLPTAKDEEVLLALIHLTDRINGFASPTVNFTRYELLKLMDWNLGAKSYRRLRESLTRWKSVTLDYRNAWRRNDRWMSEIFSLVDNVTICEAEEVQASRKGSKQADLPLSSFNWNRIFFESLQARHVKGLNYEFFQQLRTPTARRMYRFLDKRFGAGRPHWEFDLQNFAFEHVGLTRNYHTGKIKEKLQPAITELENEGFLVPRTKEQRYKKHGQTWKVSFTQQTKDCPVQEESVTKLTASGVSRRNAEQLARDFDVKTISKRIDIFRWVQEHQPETLRNPAGYLADSIRNEYEVPSDYQTPEQIQAGEQFKAKILQEREAERRRRRLEDDHERQKRAHVVELRQQLDEDELAAIQRFAVSQIREEDRVPPESSALHEMQVQLMTDIELLNRYPFVASEARTAGIDGIDQT